LVVCAEIFKFAKKNMLSKEHLSNLITKNRNSPQALVDLGYSLLEEKDLPKDYYELVLSAFDQAVKLAPRFTQAIFGRGRAKALLGYTSGAFLDYNTVLQASPSVPAAWFRRGLLYFQLKDYKSAVLDFVQTVTLDPSFLEGYLMRAYALMNLKGYEQAAQDLNHVIGFESPYAAEALYNRSKCFYSLGLMELTIKDCDNLVSIGWNSADVYHLRAMAKIHFKDFDGALLDYDEALKLAPEQPDLLHNKAELIKAIEQLKAEKEIVS
jgi:tetratricopeptide (TPR) repeat protein